MKKLTRREFTAAGIIAALGATTAFVSSCNRPTSVYGPPPDYEPEYEPEENEIETVYGPPEDYDPAENELVDVYGPPEDYDPTDNELVGVYGPPADN
ncbi:MAG: hypothetical protein J6D34_00995 [Atopobiaceae bacterium]|nr:hypothetical protein [Atopobiaceae bacterium]